MELAGLTLVVKNTFLCCIGAEALSPPSQTRRRAQTTDAVSLFCLSDEEEIDESGVSPVGDLDAFSEDGSRALLQTLKCAAPAQVEAIASKLRGQVSMAARSQHAQMVLEELLHCLATEDAAFVAEELLGHGRRAAANAHGHSVLCRLLEFSGEHPRTAALIDEVIGDDPASLCCHKFGYKVAMSILSNGLVHQQGQIVDALSCHVQRFSRHRFASQVIEHALAYERAPADGDEARGALVAQLMRHPGSLANLASHCFGTHVVRALLQFPGPTQQAVVHNLQRVAHRVVKDRYGMKLMQDFGLLDAASMTLSVVMCGA